MTSVECQDSHGKQSQLPIPVWCSGFCRLPHQDMPVSIQILMSDSETSLVNIQIQNSNDIRMFEKWLQQKLGKDISYHALAVSPKWIVVRDNCADENEMYHMRDNQIVSTHGAVSAQVLGFKNGIFILDRMPSKKSDVGDSSDSLGGDMAGSIISLTPNEMITIDELSTLGCNRSWGNENTTLQFIMREYRGNTLLQLAMPEQNQIDPPPSAFDNYIGKSFVELVLQSFGEMNCTPKPLTQGKISKAECGYDDPMDIDQEMPATDEKQPDRDINPEVNTHAKETQTDPNELPQVTKVARMVDKETETDAEIRPKVLNKVTQTTTRTSALPDAPTKEDSTKSNLTKTGHEAGTSRDKSHWSDIEAVFGNCYVWAYDTYFLRENIQNDQLKEGDLIAVKTHDSNVGTVKEICRTVSGKEDYARVRFEDPLEDIKGLKVKHYVRCSYTDSGCDKNWAFISLKHLFGRNSAFTVFAQKNEISLKDQINEIVLDEEVEASRVPHIGSVINIKDEKFQKKIKSSGIEGCNNSCYADSFLFAIFAFSKSLDVIADKIDLPQKNLAIRNIILNDVVGTLRKKFKVKWKAVQKLRNALAVVYNPAYKMEMMDVEEFALTIFGDVLQLPRFMNFVDGGADYIHQIFVTPFLDPDILPNVQLLLEQSFQDSRIQLRETPSLLLLVKLPVSDGVPLFKQVYPNPILSMSNLIESRHDRDQKFYLRAVICLSKHHYTCFVRTQPDHQTKGSWVFHDSLPENNLPICSELKDFDLLLEAMSSPSKSHIFNDEMIIWMNRLLQTCYLCVYEPEHVSEMHLTELRDTEI